MADSSDATPSRGSNEVEAEKTALNEADSTSQQRMGSALSEAAEILDPEIESPSQKNSAQQLPSCAPDLETQETEPQVLERGIDQVDWSLLETIVMAFLLFAQLYDFPDRLYMYLEHTLSACLDRGPYALWKVEI